MIEALEWMAFGLSVICVWTYGRSKIKGACVGVVTALSFILWGYVAGIPAAGLTNILFLGLHIRNLIIGVKEHGHLNQSD